MQQEQHGNQQQGRTFRDAAAAPAASRVDGLVPVSASAAVGARVRKSKKIKKIAKQGGVSSAGMAGKRKDEAAEATEIAATATPTKPATTKKGGKVATRADIVENGATDSPTGPPALNKKQRKKLAAANDGASGPVSPILKKEVVPFPYKHPKPAAIVGALFMWDTVAAFLEPRTSILLERLCRDVATVLRKSNVSNKLMQRYWNAQWARLVLDSDVIPEPKLLLLPTSLTRADGKTKWKKMYREEFPQWEARTFTGVGANNNALNEAKVFFHREELNTKLTPAQLAARALTIEETLLKAQRKRGVVVEVDNEDGKDGGAEAGGGGDGGGGGGATAKPVTLRVPKQGEPASFDRAVYKENYRYGSRKGKHQKGGDKKWSSYVDYDDGDDMY